MVEVVAGKLVFSLIRDVVYVVSVVLLLITGVIICVVCRETRGGGRGLLRLRLAGRGGSVSVRCLDLVRGGGRAVGVVTRSCGGRVVTVDGVSSRIRVGGCVSDVVNRVTGCGRVYGAGGQLLSIVLGGCVSVYERGDVRFRAGVLASGLGFVDGCSVSTLFGGLLSGTIRTSSGSSIGFVGLRVAGDLGSCRGVAVVGDDSGRPGNGGKGLVAAGGGGTARKFKAGDVQGVIGGCRNRVG